MVILDRSLDHLIKQKGLIPVQCISIHKKNVHGRQATAVIVDFIQKKSGNSICFDKVSKSIK